MLTGILIIFLSIINIIVLSILVIIIFTPFYEYSIALGFISIVLYLVVSITFFKYTNKTLKKEKNNLILLSINKIKSSVEGTSVIEFERIGNKWICKKDDNILLDLQGYLFQKSFIMAWIIRNIRYSSISNQLKLIKLLNFKLKVKNNENLKIRFMVGTKCKEYLIVENYISKNSILTRSIIKSKYYLCFLSAYSLKYMKEVKRINEKIYLD